MNHTASQRDCRSRTSWPNVRRWALWVTGAALLGTLPGEAAYAQGPLRRLGERVRERAVAPIGTAGPGQRLRRLPRPLQQPSDANLPSADLPPPEVPRMQVARPPLSPIAQTSGTGAAGSPAPPRSLRSANFNRAAAAVPGGATSRVAQSSALDQPPAELNQNAEAGYITPQPELSPLISQPPRGGRLGVTVDAPAEVTSPGLPARRPRGAMVTEVMPQSPADVAGLRTGDIIVAVQGRLITSVGDLVDEMSQYDEGEELRVQYSRGDTLGAATLTLAGPDGLAPQRTDEPLRPADSVAGDGSILGGLGSMFGGLLGGQRAGQPQQQQAADQPPPPPSPPRSSAPGTPQGPFLETLPPPQPQRQ